MQKRRKIRKAKKGLQLSLRDETSKVKGLVKKKNKRNKINGSIDARPRSKSGALSNNKSELHSSVQEEKKKKKIGGL